MARLLTISNIFSISIKSYCFAAESSNREKYHKLTDALVVFL